jgi:inosose dehydratase
MNRREFCKYAAFAAGATSAPLHAEPPRRLQAGHTGITWGNDIQQAIQDCGSLGFRGFETFGQVLETWEGKGGLGALLDQNKLSLISAYCAFNMTDPAKRKGELENVVRWAQLLKKYNGNVCVMGPNTVDRDTYSFSEAKSTIAACLNETAKALTDLGLTAALHPHTGTCIMTRDEVYGVMNSVDTRYVKFAPDVGQLAKGGADPVKILTDFLPLVRHVHLKDFDGGRAYQGYCPLGQGKVDLAAILDLLEKSPNQLTIMAELDPSPNMPLSATAAATVDRDYLRKMGYSFRR